MLGPVIQKSIERAFFFAGGCDREQACWLAHNQQRRVLEKDVHSCEDTWLSSSASSPHRLTKCNARRHRNFGDTKLNSFADGENAVTGWECKYYVPAIPQNSGRLRNRQEAVYLDWFDFLVLSTRPDDRQALRTAGSEAEMDARIA